MSRARRFLVPLFVASALGAVTPLARAATPAVAPARAEGLVLPFQEVAVSTRVAGLVESVAVKEGESVAINQALAQLASTEEKLEAERAAGVVELKKFDSAGTEKLLQKDMVRKDEALEKRTELRIAELQHQLALAALERKIVRAPIAGIVVGRKREPGEWVEPGAPFFQLVSFDRVFVQVLLPPEDAARLALAQALEVELPQLPAPNVRRGTVDFIDPRVDAASGFQRVKVLLENPGRRILPGTRGVVRLPARPAP